MILETRIANANWFHRTIIFLTFLATKSTTSRAAAKQPAAILAVIRLVDARMKTIPQNDEPRSIKTRALLLRFQHSGYSRLGVTQSSLCLI